MNELKHSITGIIAILFVLLCFATIIFASYLPDATTRVQVITGMVGLLCAVSSFYFGSMKKPVLTGVTTDGTTSDTTTTATATVTTTPTSAEEGGDKNV